VSPAAWWPRRPERDWPSDDRLGGGDAGRLARGLPALAGHAAARPARHPRRHLTGAFAAGVITGAGVGATALLIVGTGFLGGYTTFSTWMVERTYILVSITAGLAVAAAGYGLGSLV